jgi:hypothetical protein
LNQRRIPHCKIITSVQHRGGVGRATFRWTSPARCSIAPSMPRTLSRRLPSGSSIGTPPGERTASAIHAAECRSRRKETSLAGGRSQPSGRQAIGGGLICLHGGRRSAERIGSLLCHYATQRNSRLDQAHGCNSFSRGAPARVAGSPASPGDGAPRANPFPSLFRTSFAPCRDRPQRRGHRGRRE